MFLEQRFQTSSYFFEKSEKNLLGGINFEAHPIVISHILNLLQHMFLKTNVKVGTKIGLFTYLN